MILRERKNDPNSGKNNPNSGYACKPKKILRTSNLRSKDKKYLKLPFAKGSV